MKTRKKLTVLYGVLFAAAMMISSCSKEDATLQSELLVSSEAESETAQEPDSQVALESESQGTSQAESQSQPETQPDECDVTLEDQLETVRNFALPFEDFEEAKKEGYADPSPFNPSPYVPQMGFHYTNGHLLDGTFELEKPEILLYVPNEQGKLELVGVEYAVPGPPDSTPPEGFVGNEDHWHYNPNVAGGAWTLHVWVVLKNPDGIFAEHNPNVPSENPAEGCELP